MSQSPRAPHDALVRGGSLEDLVSALAVLKIENALLVVVLRLHRVRGVDLGHFGREAGGDVAGVGRLVSVYGRVLDLS